MTKVIITGDNINVEVVDTSPVEPPVELPVTTPVAPLYMVDWNTYQKDHLPFWDRLWDTPTNLEVRHNKLVVPIAKNWDSKGVGFKMMARHPSRNVMYFEYDIEVPENFIPGLGGKLPGLAGGDAPSGGKDPNNGWSARFMWRTHGEFMMYLYHPGQTGKWGQNIRGNIQRKTLTPGNHTVGIAVDVDFNGIQCWYDGDLFIDVDRGDGIDLGGFPVSATRFECFRGGSGHTWGVPEKTVFKFRRAAYYENKPRSET